MSKSNRLPADPEEQNQERAEWAAEAIRKFRSLTGADKEDAVSDLLADLAHFCDRDGFDLAHELNRACLHYDEETYNEDKDESDGHQFDRIEIQPREEATDADRPTAS